MKSTSFLLALGAHGALAALDQIQRVPNGTQDLGFVYPVSWLTNIGQNQTQGEPINVVISNKSDSYIFDQQKHGFIDFMNSVQMSYECLNQHLGGYQRANVGGGLVNQTGVLRYDFFDPSLGTCQQSIKGGNHLRYWEQGSDGAYFLAVSVEQSSSQNHNIVDNGYDLGRDYLVGNMTMSNGTLSPVTGTIFNSSVVRIRALPENNTDIINHGIPIDGDVYVVTVKAKLNSTNSEQASVSSPALGSPSVLIVALFALVLPFIM